MCLKIWDEFEPRFGKSRDGKYELQYANKIKELRGIMEKRMDTVISNCGGKSRDYDTDAICSRYVKMPAEMTPSAADQKASREKQANIQPGMRKVGGSLDKISPKFSYTIVYIAAMVIFAFGFVVGRASLASAKNSVNMRLLDGEDICPMA